MTAQLGLNISLIKQKALTLSCLAASEDIFAANFAMCALLRKNDNSVS